MHLTDIVADAHVPTLTPSPTKHILCGLKESLEARLLGVNCGLFLTPKVIGVPPNGCANRICLYVALAKQAL